MSTGESKDLTILLASPFLGLVVVAVIFGFGSLQTFQYFRRNHRDIVFFKTFVAFLWVLDALQFAFIIHSEYVYFVLNFSHPQALAHPTWGILAHLYLDCMSNMLIRGYYGWRLWRFSKNPILCAVLAICSLSAFVCGFIFSSLAFIKYKTFDEFKNLSPYMYTGLASSAGADILIAVAMCLYLYTSRTGFKKTDSILTSLMVYTINSSASTAILTIVCLITYIRWPDDLIFLGIFFCISKLFFCNLLALLNGRDSLRSQNFDHQSSAFGLSSIMVHTSGMTDNSGVSNQRKDESILMKSHSPPALDINVTRHVTKMRDNEST